VPTLEEEQHFLSELRDVLPYGVALWPAALALAHDIAARPDAFRGRRVLELGAGTGLPGIVAASLGARVVQTDRHELPMELCRRNGERNGVTHNGAAASPIEYRLVDWAAWDDAERYSWILGADVLYGETGHPELRRIFDTNLAPGGRLLLSDPFRSASIRLLEAMEADGWSVAGSRWSVGEAAPGEELRPVGVFELTPPR
jgi:predicted nicotinamide N-methyase